MKKIMEPHTKVVTTNSVQNNSETVRSDRLVSNNSETVKKNWPNSLQIIPRLSDETGLNFANKVQHLPAGTRFFVIKLWPRVKITPPPSYISFYDTKEENSNDLTHILKVLEFKKTIVHMV